MKKIFYLSIVVLASFSSCRKVLDINVDEKDKKIVANSIFSTDAPIYVQLSKSLGILENDWDVEYITNAEVKLYEEGIFVADMVMADTGMYICSKIPQAGKNYSISASVSGLTTIHASIDVPGTIPIQSIDTATISVSDYQMDYQESFIAFNCKINFNDPEDEENFYIISIINTFDDGFSTWDYPIWYTTNDPVLLDKSAFATLPNGVAGLMFSDEYLNGQNYSFSALIRQYELNIGLNRLTFVLYSLPKEQFLYYRSLELQNSIRGNPFAEPVQVFSNITNGFGIFTGYSSYTDSLIFEYNYDNEWKP